MIIDYAAPWLIALGIVAYAGSVGLAVIWVGIAWAFIRAGRSRLRWLMLIPFALGYGVLFVGLVTVAYGSLWIDRNINALIQRSAAFIGMSAGWAFTFMFLNSLWKNDKGEYVSDSDAGVA